MLSRRLALQRDVEGIVEEGLGPVTGDPVSTAGAAAGAGGGAGAEAAWRGSP